MESFDVRGILLPSAQLSRASAFQLVHEGKSFVFSGSILDCQRLALDCSGLVDCCPGPAVFTPEAQPRCRGCGFFRDLRSPLRLTQSWSGVACEWLAEEKLHTMLAFYYASLGPLEALLAAAELVEFLTNNLRFGQLA